MIGGNPASPEGARVEATGPVSPEPGSFAFNEASRALADKQVAKYPEGRQASAVKGLLDLAQRQMEAETGVSWLPRVAMDHVAGILGMPRIRVYEIATFYGMFHTAPVGRHHLRVCTTTPCWLRGSDAVLDACRKVAGCEVDEVSADGMWSVTEVECIGACVNAPVVWIGDHFYEDLDGPSTLALLARIAAGEQVPAGSMIGRSNSAPEGGPTTLTAVPEVQPWKPPAPPAPTQAAE